MFMGWGGHISVDVWEGHISVDVFGGAHKCLWGGGGT